LEIQAMLSTMCREILSDVDVKAIAKARGFPTGSEANRAVFETFFLSEIGLAKVLASLTQPEITMLHFLALLGTEVDVACFNRIYGEILAQNTWGMQTFTQIYRDVYKEVQMHLLRKGLLLVGQAPNPENLLTRLETWRFRLPPQFIPYLPPLFPKAVTLPGEGDANRAVLRDKVLELGKSVHARPDKDHPWAWSLPAGRLMLGANPFAAEALEKWRLAGWEADLQAAYLAFKTSIYASRSVAQVVPVSQACTYAFGQLGPGAWITGSDLDLVLRVFCAAANPTGAAACDLGWRWGYLARQRIANKDYYRPVATFTEDAGDVDPGVYLSAGGQRGIEIDLARVPYRALEQIAGMSRIQMNAGQVTAAPDAIAMGRAFARVQRLPLTGWLRDQAPDYREALAAVAAQWGKQILHHNLLLARIDDVGLRALIERDLAGLDLVVLSEHHIAFPRTLLPEVEKIVKKSGFVIKTVTDGAVTDGAVTDGAVTNGAEQQNG
jgi:hypothetical protein